MSAVSNPQRCSLTVRCGLGISLGAFAELLKTVAGKRTQWTLRSLEAKVVSMTAPGYVEDLRKVRALKADHGAGDSRRKERQTGP